MKLKVIIAARGGSKRVPGKNIKLLKNKPLIAYPITEAKKCKYTSEVYVSTDDTDIKKVAEEYGAKIILRPKKYATDTALDIDVMRHVVRVLNDEDDIVHLRATTPIIKSEVIDDAIKYFFDNEMCTGLRSAHEAPETAYKFFSKDDIYWKGLFDNEIEGDYYNWPSQSLPKTYHPNGYVDILRPKQFMKSDNLHGDKMLAFITPFTYEVDTPDDFKILEAVYG